ncbi:Acetyltransferase (GNAT) family protein [Grimontia celer]|uniref:Acetyltransferase (GNAT) family protein n=1 Tax=Grimontia celer TaxID=1796497 RepID=A0A128F559_9GAMM|nr:GNAT family N-acetyltransferase [Grimontia celer]CZF81923.1 Acetyltransferase (GNAT) family protein [Grimontia celer]
MELVVPALEFEKAFNTFFDDFAHNDVENSAYYQEGKTQFKRYVQRLLDESEGLNLQNGYVPCSHFWLMDSEQNILGAIRVRHHIDNDFLALECGHIGYDIAPSHRRKGHGTTMLKLALPRAKSLGISKVLITADEDNLASQKVIQANGGKYENTIVGKVNNWPIARYWVECE